MGSAVQPCIDLCNQDQTCGSVRCISLLLGLPLQHNISHDNVEGDRIQDIGGSIANINSDGTFTHIQEVPEGVSPCSRVVVKDVTFFAYFIFGRGFCD